MADLPLITNVHQIKEWVHRDGSIPSKRLQVQVGTETGPLVLWISISAAKELADDLTHILRDKRFQ